MSKRFVLSAGDGASVSFGGLSPAGFERYFEELAPLLTSGGPPDVAAPR